MNQSPKDRSRPLELNSSLFRVLDTEHRRQISAACSWRRYAKDSLVLAQREASDEVLFLHEGRVRVTMCSGNGRQVTFRDLEDGDLIAELAAIDQRPRSAEVIAVTDCVIASLPAARFVELISQTPVLALWEMRRLTEIIRDLTDRQLELVALPLPTRLCAFLLRLSSQSDHGPGQAGHSLIELPRHEEIAHLIGSQREAVTKAFRDLEARGLVERQGKQMMVHLQRLNAVLDAAI